MWKRLARGLCVGVAIIGSAAGLAAPVRLESREALGEALFFDTNLSKNRSQAGATCHMPQAGFVDARQTPAGPAVSLGDDGRSLGDRNAPTASYARFAPPFHRTATGDYVGGLFLDGRAATLEDQAGGPPLNPVEWGCRTRRRWWRG